MLLVKKFSPNLIQLVDYQGKGGAKYRLSNTTDVFFNGGYVSKVPIFDQVIDDGTGVKAEDPDNEKFTNFEVRIKLQISRW